MSAVVATELSQRADEIRRAAIPVFAARGFRRTSMADIARAAGVSRPALYQYYENRADIFRAALQVLLEDATDAALAALHDGGTVAERIDGYLQRASADGYEALATTPFGAELMEARHEFAADVANAAFDRARRGLRAFVTSNSAVDSRTRSAVIDLLVLSPVGLKGDEPTPAAYRRRLSALAAAVARLLDAG
jgi:AcrR family transcriptional regulator